MTQKMIARTVTAVIVGATALLGATAGPAAAGSQSDAQCYSGQVCAYYQGALVYRNVPMYPGQCYFVSHEFDFVRNYSGIQQTAYSGTNCTGRSVRIDSNQSAGVNL